ncbi:hypothetical protein GCM10028856_12070 [Halopiger thermotolerans]
MLAQAGVPFPAGISDGDVDDGRRLAAIAEHADFAAVGVPGRGDETRLYQNDADEQNETDGEQRLSDALECHIGTAQRESKGYSDGGIWFECGLVV